MHSFCAAVPKIMSRTHTNLPIWHIGTTADATRAHAELGRPGCFQSWAMEEFDDAQGLRDFFGKLGMKGELAIPVSTPPGHHVYIVKQRGEHCRTCETRPQCGRPPY